jgi:hypothetical protein
VLGLDLKLRLDDIQKAKSKFPKGSESEVGKMAFDGTQQSKGTAKHM